MLLSAHSILVELCPISNDDNVSLKASLTPGYYNRGRIMYSNGSSEHSFADRCLKQAHYSII